MTGAPASVCPRCGDESEGPRYPLGDEPLCWSCFNAATEHLVAAYGEEAPGEARKRGTLPYLPDRDAALSELRGWLTRAFAPPSGYTFDGFERHGRRLSDPAWVTFRTPAGGEARFRFPEQRALAKPTNLRSSVVSITDGLCRMGPVTNPEASDVWVALCAVAHVAAQQDEVEEFREHLDGFLRVTEIDGAHTLEPSGRLDALLALQARGAFERRHARLMADDVNERHWDRRPIRLLDTVTAAAWVRVTELATYLRHVVGLQLGHGALDGRMSEIGAARVQFEARNGRAHPHLSLYRLPDERDEAK
jgi:hypothetical protein